MGLKPETPGWGTIAFQPQPPSGLESASLSITTPKGVVKASFEQVETTIRYVLTVPEGAKARIHLRNVSPSLEVDGKTYTCRTDGHLLVAPVTLSPGEHQIQVQRMD